MSSFQLKPEYEKEDFRNSISDILSGKKECSPFPHVTFDRFQVPEAVVNLQKDLAAMKWSPKVNDLYSLNQTCDFEALEGEGDNFQHLRQFRTFMKDSFRSYLEDRTKVKLSTEKVTMTGSRYGHTHLLLPHDDRVADRKYAFVYYLTERWTEKDGGQLQLYAVNEKNEPTKAERSLLPQFNQLVIFEVSDKSWHQVAEVLSKNKERLSINGWFHVDEAPEFVFPPFVDPLLSKHFSVLGDFGPEDADILAINPTYYAEPTWEQFVPKGTLVLDEFFVKGSFVESQILDELDQLKFAEVGPVHKRHFEVADIDESQLTSKSSLYFLLRGVKSHMMCFLLNKWTGANLSIESNPSDEDEPTAPKRAKLDTEDSGSSDSSPSKDLDLGDEYAGIDIACSIRRYKAGDYTAMDDQSAAAGSKNDCVIDMRLFFTREWPFDAEEDSDPHVTGPGGFLNYYVPGATEAMFRYEPANNQAVIAFREANVMNFTKYVNSRAAKNCFYVIDCTYFGVQRGENQNPLSAEFKITEAKKE